VWAYECQGDIIARELKMDPLEFRRVNILREGRPHATGTVMADIDLNAILDRLATGLDWNKPLDRGTGPVRRGRGIALGIKACVSPTTSVAQVNIYGDGSCGIFCSTVDMGQGSDTVMAQIAGEVLGLPAETIRVVHPDTDVTPYDMGTLGSRSTYHMGNAVRTAALDAREQLVRIASAALKTAPDKLECKDGALYTQSGSRMTFKEIMVTRFAMQAGNIIGVGAFLPPYDKPDHETGQSENITPFWMIGAAGAEVEVDTETGRIHVTKLINVGDPGSAINPDIVRRQLVGGATMQYGFTLFEEMLFNDGQVINASFADYKIPGMLDLPDELTGELVEVPDRHGPFGARGIGETGMFAVSPAIGNALYDATGVRVMEMPLTPERVLRALRRAEGRPLENE
jgi:CO/xanthine dehydrogenase Mo-binding subunit